MLTRPHQSAGFAVPADADAPRDGNVLPALIASLALALSIAVVLAAVNAARVTHLF